MIGIITRGGPYQVLLATRYGTLYGTVSLLKRSTTTSTTLGGRGITTTSSTWEFEVFT